MYVLLNSQYDFSEETLATAGLEEGVAAFQARAAAGGRQRDWLQKNRFGVTFRGKLIMGGLFASYVLYNVFQNSYWELGNTTHSRAAAKVLPPFRSFVFPLFLFVAS